MKIKDLATLGETAPIDIKVMVTEKKTLEKRNQEKYLQLSVQDSSGAMDFPVWNDYAKRNETLAIAQIVRITGFLTFYDGKPQIKDPVFFTTADTQIEDYIARYDVPKELYKFFDEIIESLDEKHKLLVLRATGAFGYSESKWKEFTHSPAAKGHHHAAIHGLFLHTVGLLKNAVSILDLYGKDGFFFDASEKIDRSRFLTKVILHDIGKTKEYSWRTGIKRKNTTRDHIIMGCAMVEEFAGKDFTEEEVDDICASIMTHHGEFENCKYGRAKIKTIEDQLLHLVDMIDSKIVQALEG